MENLVGSKVWVIKYSDYGMSDGDSVFSTREKALAHLDAEFERLKDIWKNRVLIDKDAFDDEPSWYVWSFDCLYSYEGQVEVQLYCTEIL
jgi:hypothetical protein